MEIDPLIAKKLFHSVPKYVRENILTNGIEVLDGDASTKFLYNVIAELNAFESIISKKISNIRHSPHVSGDIYFFYNKSNHSYELPADLHELYEEMVEEKNNYIRSFMDAANNISVEMSDNTLSVVSGVLAWNTVKNIYHELYTLFSLLELELSQGKKLEIYGDEVILAGSHQELAPIEFVDPSTNKSIYYRFQDRIETYSGLETRPDICILNEEKSISYKNLLNVVECKAGKFNFELMYSLIGRNTDYEAKNFTVNSYYKIEEKYATTLKFYKINIKDNDYTDIFEASKEFCSTIEPIIPSDFDFMATKEYLVDDKHQETILNTIDRKLLENTSKSYNLEKNDSLLLLEDKVKRLMLK